MKKLIVFICILFSLAACCEVAEMYEQVSVTFTDGTIKTYKTCDSSPLKNGTITLYLEDGGKLYLTNCKEVEIKQVIKRINNNY